MKTTESMTPSNDGSSSSSSNSSSSSSSTSTTTSSSSSALVPRILSGSVGSIVTALAVTPLEVVKIRQQSAGVQSNIPPTSFRGIKVSPCPAGCGTLVLNNGLMDCVLPIESTCLRGLRESTTSNTTTTTTTTYSRSGNRGTLSTLLSIFKHEGYAGLYAGLRPTLVMSVPSTVMYFSAYDEISTSMRRYHLANFSNSNSTTIMAAHGNGNNETAKTNSTNTTTTVMMQAKSEEDANQHPAYIPLVAGSTARLLASLATAPLELIRTRQASIGGMTTTMMEEFRSLLRTNGVSSLYVGVAPTLWRDVPFSAIYWLFLERFRNGLANDDYGGDDASGLFMLGDFGGRYYKDRGMAIPPSVEAGHAFVSGAAAGSIAAAFTTPFDVVKTRRQMVIGQAETTTMTTTIESCNHLGLKEVGHHTNQGRFSGNNMNSASSSSSLGTFGHMQQIMQQEGIAGLWKGNVTRMVKVAPACAIMISCYEFGKRMFGEVL